jgi:hypothetical protein
MLGDVMDQTRMAKKVLEIAPEDRRPRLIRLGDIEKRWMQKENNREKLASVATRPVFLEDGRAKK